MKNNLHSKISDLEKNFIKNRSKRNLFHPGSSSALSNISKEFFQITEESFPNEKFKQNDLNADKITSILNSHTKLQEFIQKKTGLAYHRNLPFSCLDRIKLKNVSREKTSRLFKCSSLSSNKNNIPEYLNLRANKLYQINSLSSSNIILFVRFDG